MHYIQYVLNLQATKHYLTNIKYSAFSFHLFLFFRNDYCRDWPQNLCHTFTASCQTRSATDYIPAFCQHYFVDFGHVYDPQLGDTRDSTGVFWTFGLGCHFSHKFATDDLLQVICLQYQNVFRQQTSERQSIQLMIFYKLILCLKLSD